MKVCPDLMLESVYLSTPLASTQPVCMLVYTVDVQIFLGANIQGLFFLMALIFVGQKDAQKIKPAKNKTNENKTHGAL